MMKWLTGLRLSIGQWLGVMAAAVIGALAFALRLQGSRLRRAETKLVTQEIGHTIATDDQKVEAARDKFAEALRDFKKEEGDL